MNTKMRVHSITGTYTNDFYNKKMVMNCNIGFLHQSPMARNEGRFIAKT